MTFAASVALWAVATGATAADLPRAPCEAQDEVRTVLQDAASRGSSELDAQLAKLERLVDYPLLRDDAGDASHRVDVAMGRLGSLCTARTQRIPDASAKTSGAVDAQRLQSILSRPEFDGARDRKGDAFAALLRRISEFFKSLFESHSMQTGAIWTRFLILALATALAIFGILRLRQARRGGRSTRARAFAESGPLVLEDPTAHLGRAREALGSNDARAAIREGLLALLSVLERQRWARPDRVKTNRELARELPGRGAPSEIAAQVETLTRWYDRTFYSLAPVPEDEARRFVDEIAAFQARVAGGAR